MPIGPVNTDGTPRGPTSHRWAYHPAIDLRAARQGVGGGLPPVLFLRGVTGYRLPFATSGTDGVYPCGVALASGFGTPSSNHVVLHFATLAAQTGAAVVPSIHPLTDRVRLDPGADVVLSGSAVVALGWPSGTVALEAGVPAQAPRDWRRNAFGPLVLAGVGGAGPGQVTIQPAQSIGALFRTRGAVGDADDIANSLSAIDTVTIEGVEHHAEWLVVYEGGAPYLAWYGRADRIGITPEDIGLPGGSSATVMAAAMAALPHPRDPSAAAITRAAVIRWLHRGTARRLGATGAEPIEDLGDGWVRQRMAEPLPGCIASELAGEVRGWASITERAVSTPDGRRIAGLAGVSRGFMVEGLVDGPAMRVDLVTGLAEGRAWERVRGGPFPGTLYRDRGEYRRFGGPATEWADAYSHALTAEPRISRVPVQVVGGAEWSPEWNTAGFAALARVALRMQQHPAFVTD